MVHEFDELILCDGSVYFLNSFIEFFSTYKIFLAIKSKGPLQWLYSLCYSLLHLITETCPIFHFHIQLLLFLNILAIHSNS